MSDLETRLRDGLEGDVTQPDIDLFLSDVRRRSSWRRGRHAAAGVAALVAVVIGGSVVLQHGSDQRIPPQPVTPTPSPTSSAVSDVRARVVDVRAAGSHVFRLTVRDGCTRCSVVSERTPDGEWQRLGSLNGGSRGWGPAERILMAPDGRDGWAWQPELWSTHDGGRTWSRITDGPGRRTVRGRQIALGATSAWSVWTSPGGRQELWRTPLGSDAWQRVRTPQHGDLVGVTPQGWVVVHDTGEGASGAVVVLQGPQEWTHYDQPFTSDSWFSLVGDVVLAPHDGTVSRLAVGPTAAQRWEQVPRLPRASRDFRPIDVEHLLVSNRDGWWLVMPGGTVRTNLGRRVTVDHVSATDDGTVWLTTYSGRIYTSTDGLHWRLQP
jgi:hypothetical protein